MNGGLRLRDLGVYRLRGASTSERVFQLDYPGSADTFSPLNAESGYASHLPLQLTRFFGREPEIERLGTMLSSGGARLVTLTGPPGCGKTRLAIEVAARLLETFRGAVWFVPLADLRDVSQVLDRALGPLGISRLPRAAPLEQIVTALAGQPALLVFDNFEHLTEGAGEVHALLEKLPDLRCLVTSRRRLGLAGERGFAVLPLATPASAASPEELLRNATVQLFVDRAQAVQPDFQLTPTNTGAVAELCRQLEGVPLALELAAARSQVLSPAQLLKRLGNRLDLERSARRGGEDRHRSLRGAVEWSYELLTPGLRRFFHQLSVFRDGWTAEAAEAVCDEPHALDCLTELAECSLILVEQAPLGPRFSMLETLREYAAERLAESGEREATRDRHLDHFLALAERVRDVQMARGGVKEAESVAVLAPDHPNLLAALVWCQASSQHVQAGLRLAGALHWFWKKREHNALGRAESERALARDATWEPTAARASALLGAGCFSLLLGDFSAARTQLAESLEISRMLDDTPQIASAIKHMGDLALRQGDLDAAEKAFEQYLDLERRLGRDSRIADAISNLGRVSLWRGDRAAARALSSEALARYRALGHRAGEAGELAVLGALTTKEGNHELAASFLSEALAIAQEIGSRFLEAQVLGELGGVLKARGDLDSAGARFDEALVISREVGQTLLVAVNLVNLAYVNLLLLSDVAADRESVRAPLLECLRLVRELGSRDPGTWGLHVAAGLLAAEAKEAPSPERGCQLRELATCLHGAAEALRRAVGMVSLHDGEEPCPHLPPLVEALGQSMFDAAWRRGEAMSFDDALACAIEALEGGAPARPSRSDPAVLAPASRRS